MKRFAFAMAILPAFWATDVLAQQAFGDNECTDDCSGHKAGYEWAEQNNVVDPSDCDGNSQSFNEGCQTYTEDPNRGGDEDDEGNDID